LIKNGKKMDKKGKKWQKKSKNGKKYDFFKKLY